MQCGFRFFCGVCFFCGLCVLLGNGPTRQHLGVVLHQALFTVLFDQLGNASLGGGCFGLDFPVPHLRVNALLGSFGLCTLGTKGSSTYVYARTGKRSCGFRSSSIQHINQRLFCEKLVAFIEPNLTGNLSGFLGTASDSFPSNCLGRFLECSLRCFLARLPFYGLCRHLLDQSCSRAENRVERTGHNTNGQRCTASLFEVIDDSVGALILGKLRQFFL